MKIRVTHSQVAQAYARARMAPDDQRDPEAVERLGELYKKLPGRKLNTQKLHSAIAADAFPREDQKRAIASMYLKDTFGMGGELPSITRAVFGKEMGADEAFSAVSSWLEIRHGKSEFREFAALDEGEQKNRVRNQMEHESLQMQFKAAGGSPGFVPRPTKFSDEQVNAEHKKHLDDLFNADPAMQIQWLETQLTPKQERLGQLIAVTDSPMDYEDELLALNPEDRMNTLRYVAAWNPERDLNWAQQIGPRMRDAVKRSRFALIRTVENHMGQATPVLDSNRLFAALQKAYPGGLLPDGSPVFGKDGGFASDDARQAVQDMIESRLRDFNQSLKTSVGLSAGVPMAAGAFSQQVPDLFNPAEDAAAFIDQVPDAFREGQREYTRRGIERDLFQLAELEKFRSTGEFGDSALHAMEMGVDMVAALAASAVTRSPAGGIAYSYARVQSELQDTLEYDHGVARDNAFGLSVAAAVPTALIEYSQIKGASSALNPAQAKFLAYLKNDWKSILGVAMKQRGITMLEEIGEESAQSLVEQGMKLAAREFADAEGVEVQQLLGDWFTDTVEAAKVMPWMMGPSIAMDAGSVALTSRKMKTGDPAKLHEIGLQLERMHEEIGSAGPNAVPNTVIENYLAAQGTGAKRAVLSEAGLLNREEAFRQAESIRRMEEAQATETIKVDKMRADKAAIRRNNYQGDATAPDAGVDMSVVERMQAKASGAANMEVVTSQDELPSEIMEQIPEGEHPAGLHHDGKVYLIAQNIANDPDAALTWIHEQGHGAVEALGGLRDRVLSNVIKQSGGVERIRELMPEIGDESNPLDIAHEYIARIAEEQIDADTGKMTGAGQRILEKATDAALDWLGITTDQMRADRQVRQLVRGLVRNVFQGSEQNVPTSGKAQLSRNAEYTARESAVTVALRMIAGEDMSHDAAAPLLKEHYGKNIDVGDVIRRANRIVRTVEASSDLSEMDQLDINYAVRTTEAAQREADRRNASAYLKGIYDSQTKTDHRQGIQGRKARRMIKNRDSKLEKQRREASERMAESKREYYRMKNELNAELKKTNRTAREALRATREDINAKISALETYIKAQIPAGNTSPILRIAAGKAREQLRKIPRAANFDTRQRRLNEIVGEIDSIFYNARKREAVADIKETLTKKIPKVGKNKILSGKPLTPEVHDKLKIIREAFAVRGPDNWTIVEELSGELEEKQHALDLLQESGEVAQETLDKAIHERNTVRDKLWAHETYGDINGGSRSLKHLIAARKELSNIINTGRTMHEAFERTRRQEVETDIWNAVESISQGEGMATTAAGRRRKWYEERVSGIRRVLSAYDTLHQSWEYLLDKLIEPGEGTLEGGLTRKFSRMAHTATVKYDASLRKLNERIDGQYKKIFGLKTDWQLIKTRNENSKQVDDCGVYQYNADGAREPLKLSKNEAYKLWQLWQDESLRKAMVKNNFTEQTIKECKKFAGKQLIEWARWQLEVFYPEYYHTINPIFRQINAVNMPYSENYSPVYRHLSGRDVKELSVEQRQGEARTSINNMSLKSRVANMKDFELMDGDTVLSLHITHMEHYKAWALPLQQMNGVFRSQDVQEALGQHMGHKARNVLNQHLEDFTRGGTDRALIISTLDKIRANYTKAVVAMKLPIFLKQLTSIPAYALDMPVGSWLRGQVAFWANPLKAIKVLKDSEYMRSRYDFGWDRDIRLALKASTARNPVKAGFDTLTNKAMFLTKAGDKAAIVVGGYSVYLHHYNLQKKNGADHETAHREAIFQFEMATRRTQQSGNVMDLGWFQRGGSLWKTLTMFSTSPISYHRAVSAGVRDIVRTKGRSMEGWKRIFIGHFLLPSLFQWVANGGRWDDEDQLRAAILGNMNRLVIGGEIADAMLSALISRDIRQMGGGALGSTTRKGQVIFSSINRMLVEGDMSREDVLKVLDDIAEVSGNLSGVPYAGTRNIITGIGAAASGESSKPVRRAVGFSPYALDDAR